MHEAGLAVVWDRLRIMEATAPEGMAINRTIAGWQISYNPHDVAVIDQWGRRLHGYTGVVIDPTGHTALRFSDSAGVTVDGKRATAFLADVLPGP